MTCTCESCRRLRIRLILNTYFPERLANDNAIEQETLVEREMERT